MTDTILSRETLNSLRASRKKDRELIAHEIRTVAASHGAVTMEKAKGRVVGYGGAGIDLEVSLNGVGVLLCISDLHGGDSVLLHWHNSKTGQAEYFTPEFCSNVGASNFVRLHHKATSNPADWFSLVMMVDAGLYLAARGEAFIKREP